MGGEPALMTSLLPLASIVDNLKAAGDQTGWNTQQFIAQCVGITVLFIVLNKFAWKPVRVMLEERRKAIEESMANADRIKRELADAEKARLDVLKKANDQATAIIADAHKAANMVVDHGNTDASAQAADIIRRAHEASVIDRDRLMAELKRDIGHLVIQTTEKVAGKVLTSDDQTRLHDETLRQLGATQN
jgi:F-type H+-transporting ATPase subunit b